MTDSYDNQEYKDFISKYKMQIIEYEEKPQKIFPRDKFNLLKILKNFKQANLLHLSFPTFMNEPVSFLQRAFMETLRYNHLLDIAAEKTKPQDRIAYISAYMVSMGHSLCLGRNLKPFNPLLGETYEFYDPKTKVALISENISTNPLVNVCHVQNEKWEYTYNLISDSVYQITKIRLEFDCKIVFKFKSDGDSYMATRPNYIIHDVSSSDPWCEYKGSQYIKSLKSHERAELQYLGCPKYQNESCIQGKLFDEKNEETAELVGCYLKKFCMTRKDSQKCEQLWEVDPDDSIFSDYFSFRKSNFKINEVKYPVTCPTDTRKRPDIRCLEIGNYDDADATKISLEKHQRSEISQRAKENIKYTPKYFVKIFNEEDKRDEYEYTYEYWSCKLHEDFSRSQDIFKISK